MEFKIKFKLEPKHRIWNSTWPKSASKIFSNFLSYSRSSDKFGECCAKRLETPASKSPESSINAHMFSLAAATSSNCLFTRQHRRVLAQQQLFTFFGAPTVITIIISSATINGIPQRAFLLPHGGRPSRAAPPAFGRPKSSSALSAAADEMKTQRCTYTERPVGD